MQYTQTVKSFLRRQACSGGNCRSRTRKMDRELAQRLEGKNKVTQSSQRSEHGGRGESSGDSRCTILANFREVLMRRVSTFALFVLIFAAGAFGQATPKESLLVLSKHDHTLAIVDPATLKVVAKIPV